MTETRNPNDPNRVRVCQCGCGEALPKARKHGRFVSPAHRMRAWRAEDRRKRAEAAS